MALQETHIHSSEEMAVDPAHALRDQLPESFRNQYDTLLDRYDSLRDELGRQAFAELPEQADLALGGIVNKLPYLKVIREGVAARTKRLYVSPAEAAHYKVQGTLDTLIDEYSLRPTPPNPNGITRSEREANEQKDVAVRELDKNAFAFTDVYRMKLEQRVRGAYGKEQKQQVADELATDHETSTDIIKLAAKPIEEKMSPALDAINQAVRETHGQKVGRSIFGRRKNADIPVSDQKISLALSHFEQQLDSLENPELDSRARTRLRSYIQKHVAAGENQQEILAVINGELGKVYEEVSERAFTAELVRHLKANVIPTLRHKGLIKGGVEIAPSKDESTRGIIQVQVAALRAKGFSDGQIFTKLMRTVHTDAIGAENADSIDVGVAVSAIKDFTGK